MPSFVDLPVETFIDYILPLLPIRALLSLGATNRDFYKLTSDDTFWKRKLEADFNFPVSETARATGWKFLYSRLSRPKVYVWGTRNNGRLGLPPHSIPNTMVPAGIPYPVRLRIPRVRVIDLVAGGMSFHALNSQGDVYVWGALNGENLALTSEGFCEPGKKTDTPMRLKLDCRIRSISCARLFSAALDSEANVWTFVSWGRPFRLVSPLLDKSSPDTTPVQVECGWYFVSILTQSGDVLVYWPTIGGMDIRLREKNNELHQNREGLALVSEDEPDVIPCYPFDLEFNPVRLPAIPQDLPVFEGVEDDDERVPKLTRLAGMDCTLIGLTNKGHVLRYNALTRETEYQLGHWEYLPDFSEVSKVRENAAFADGGLKVPSVMRITHISASFLTFFAYSTGPESLVLKGTTDLTQPEVIPALQYKDVISVVLGDYHYGALTATGKLLTWGAFSNGALGLGEPVEIEPGQPGGFRTDQERQAMRGSQYMRVTPPNVAVPTEVRFDHGEATRRKTHCFAVAAAGWHTGALVIDLEPDDESQEETLPMPGGFPVAQPPTHVPEQPHGHHIVPLVGHRGGALPFRIGFAGRGITRFGGGFGMPFNGRGSDSGRGRGI